MRKGKRYRIRAMNDSTGIWFYIQKRFLYIAWKTIPGLHPVYRSAERRLEEIMEYDKPRYF